MDNKEAIYRIQDHMRVHRLYEPNAVWINEALNLAIKALHGQEPKTVIDCADALDGIVVGRCPNCDKSIVNNIREETRFCKFCGQAVKWD